MTPPQAYKTVQTRPCLRIVYVRYAHCDAHDIERVDGIDAAIAGRSISPHMCLTDKGREDAKGLSPDALLSFAMGPYLLESPARFDSEITYVTDGSEAAIQTADAAGWPCKRLTIEESHEITVPSDCVRIVLVLASSGTIKEEISRHCDSAKLVEKFGPPLCSISMLDAFAGFTPAFIHCLGNTALRRKVCCWHNSA